MNTHMEVETNKSVVKHINALKTFTSTLADYDATMTDIVEAHTNQENEATLLALDMMRELQLYGLEIACNDLKQSIAELVIANTTYTLVKES